MLKRRILRKIFISNCALFALFVIYLIPNEKSIDISVNDFSYNEEYVYLLDDNNLLGRTKVIIESKDLISKVEELIDILIIGGKKESSIPNGFRSLIPSETILNSIIYENGILKLDFNPAFLDSSYDIKIIESLIYTLTELEGINGISITVVGVPLTKLPISNINIPEVLKREFGINKKYDIKTFSSVNKVTEYFISKHNDKYYYVPVTKYINDQREKINVIIEDMVSSNIYDTDLMSFINCNTKLLKTNIIDDTMELYFNNYILNDFNENNILEEVKETILLSIKDNYDVNNVIFYVDDLEIYKSVIKTLE